MSKDKKRFRAVCFEKGAGAVDKEAGIIRDVILTTEGPALGHGVHLNEQFIDDALTIANEKGFINSRWTHGSMSGDALGQHIGRIMNFTKGKDSGGRSVLRGDLHLSETAKKMTSENIEGSLYDYLLTAAENDPDTFGMSIVFEPGDNTQAEGEDIEDDSAFETIKYRGDDGKIATERRRKTFTSIADLSRADVVGDPAAAPDGMFGRDGQSPAAIMSKFLDDNPSVLDMFESADDVQSMVTGFVERYTHHKTQKETAMSKTKTPEQEELTEEKIGLLGTVLGAFGFKLSKLESSDKDPEEEQEESQEETPDGKKGTNTDTVLPEGDSKSGTDTDAAPDAKQGEGDEDDDSDKLEDDESDDKLEDEDSDKLEDDESDDKLEDEDEDEETPGNFSQASLKALRAEVRALSSSVVDLQREKVSLNSAKEASETKLAAANAKLKALGSGLVVDEDVANAPVLVKYASWTDACKGVRESKNLSGDEAWDFCQKHYSALYLKFRNK